MTIERSSSVWAREINELEFVGEVSSLERIIEKYGFRVKSLHFSFLEYNRKY